MKLAVSIAIWTRKRRSNLYAYVPNVDLNGQKSNLGSHKGGVLVLARYK